MNGNSKNLSRGPAWAALVLVLLAGPLVAQTLPESFSTGPAIPNHGPVAPQPGDAFNLVPGEKYQVLFDVAFGSRDEHALNRRLESVARFGNL